LINVFHASIRLSPLIIPGGDWLLSLGKARYRVIESVIGFILPPGRKTAGVSFTGRSLA